MAFVFNATVQVRKNVLEYIKDLSDEQLLWVPENFNNNIAWQLGHIITIQQLLSYGLSNESLLIPQTYVSLFRNGTTPTNWKEKPDIAEVKSNFLHSYQSFEEDYKNGKFKNFKPYTTATSITLNSIEEVITFIFGHDMTHIGMIQSITKLVR